MKCKEIEKNAHFISDNELRSSSFNDKYYLVQFRLRKIKEKECGYPDSGVPEEFEILFSKLLEEFEEVVTSDDSDKPLLKLAHDTFNDSKFQDSNIKEKVEVFIDKIVPVLLEQLKNL